ncbi:hypothetical protein [Ktedonobacter racemifer]|uniref:Uncharacterized protein n=1 Tax=Ktedonobacter racemifer DSM 44963 TaxID=485913 RepID=D6U5L6_KTERA|nr:hypothetical protein [Ktedonobacter racemifer]EFH80277.1 hypothetical protein Krac_0864 [Ktedonobacter racemifer DSM 44963]
MTTKPVILAHIQVDPTAPEKLTGGEIQCLEPWNIGDGTLSPLAFSCDDSPPVTYTQI